MRIKNGFARIAVAGIAIIVLATGNATTEPAGISVVEIVEIKNGNRAEAIYYYENNWMSFRRDALELGYIDSFELVIGNEYSDDGSGMVLITHFESKAQFNEIEARFEKIMQGKSLQLLNDIEPADFRQSVFVVTGVRHRDDK